MPAALRLVDRKLADVAAAYRERLAPAIDRVWREEIAALGRDLRVWVRKLPEARDWRPSYFEFSFGLSDEGRDPRSVSEPVTIDGRFRLRGSVDLVELAQGGAQVRVTDHKTGKNRSTPRTVIGGGGMLQPVLYGMAIEADPLEAGRLGPAVLLHRRRRVHRARDPAQRRRTAAPASKRSRSSTARSSSASCLPRPPPRACTWCDFRAVCGPDEEKHVARKPADLLGDLTALRGMP